jgi:hypothetical protein
MATQKEEAAEQAFFAEKVKEQEEEDMKHEKETEQPEKTVDSLGQENPAQDMERRNIKAARERQEKSDKEAGDAEPKS